MICDKTDPTAPTLVGDINFFLSKGEETGVIQAEVNVMIGEGAARRKGLAQEALLLGLRYLIQHHQVSFVLARISDENLPSISMFQHRLGWAIESHSDVFSETTFKLTILPSFLDDLISNSPEYAITQEIPS